MHHSLEHDMDEIRAVGHGAMALVNAGLLLAIVAVILSGRSSTADVIRAIFTFLAWLVGQVVKPISGGRTVTLSGSSGPAGSYPSAPTSNAAGAGSGGVGGGASPGSGGEPPRYPVTTHLNGVDIVTGTSSDPLYPGQKPYVGVNPDGSAQYAQ
jgi:hypothetical protein